MKIDLSKTFDRVSWMYVRMLLMHLGFHIEFINWVMVCLTSVSFAILINGVATSFFQSQRGLRQGCPLSPLLFLLAVEGLSQLINDAQRKGTIQGLEVETNLKITHLLFMDDILLFTSGRRSKTLELKRLLKLFLKATCLQINSVKSQPLLKGFTGLEVA